MSYGRQKRIVDVVVAGVASVVTLPIVVVLAIGSAISFRAWPFFTQPRLGKDGAVFRFIKIRSLPKSAPDTADKYELAAVDNTRYGRFLRKSHLDELPQLWLVVWGTMSLIGPRPEMPELAATFDPDFVAKRTAVRPGCTGLWQISADAAGLIGEAPQYDLAYIERRSARLDWWILMRTARVTFGGRTLSALSDAPDWTNLPDYETLPLDAA